jgi:hypothetical protein
LSDVIVRVPAARKRVLVRPASRTPHLILLALAVKRAARESGLTSHLRDNLRQDTLTAVRASGST